MEAFWSEGKCGDTLILANQLTIFKILEEELSLEYGPGFGYVLNRIRSRIANSEIGNPFSHITQEKFDKFALRENTPR